MKKITLLFIMCFVGLHTTLYAQNFITTWQTTTTNETITIPTTGSGYNYDIDWDNDGTFDTLGATGNATNTYATIGIHTIVIRGSFPRIYFNNTGDRNKIRTISQWGNNSWQSMASAFFGCNNLTITATDAPNLTGVTDMSFMFVDAIAFNQNIGSWDVSNVTNMSNMFVNASVFNQNIGSWDVSSVTNMNAMFFDASSFNIDLGNWTVNSVMDMANMFRNASSFNGDVSNWDVSNVTTMGFMFRSASAFNGDVSNWNVSSVTDMVNMFFFASTFDKNLGNWDISSVGNMTSMLNSSGMSLDNYDNTLIGWENQMATPSGLSLGAGGLAYCVSETARMSLINNFGWIITGDVLDCSAAFITTWKTNNIGTSNPSSITIPTIGVGYNYDVDWDNDGIFDELGITENVTHDFGVAGTYTIQIRGNFPRIYFNNGGDRLKIIAIEQWGNFSWTSMASAFYGASNLIINTSNPPNLTGVIDMSFMFFDATSFNGDLNSWDLINVINLANMFESATSFNGDVSSWDVSSVINISNMFRNASSFNGDVSSWDVSSVTTMRKMFEFASEFNGDLSSWDISSVTNISSMFRNASAFNGDLSSWDISSVTNISSMFRNASSFNGNLSSWDVSNVTTIRRMFELASAFNGDLNNWDVSNVTQMERVFYGASAFNGDLSSWDVSSGNDMSEMFNAASTFNGDVSGWDVNSVIDMSSMFNGASAFDKNLGNWDISSVSNMTNMLDNTAMSLDNYDNTLIGWENQTATPSGLTLGAVDLTYCNGETARTSLIDNFGWVITGDVLDCTTLSNNDFEQASFTLYPNPTQNTFKIEGLLEDSELEIYNLSGQLVLKQSNYTTDERVDVSNLSSSIYFVKISNSKGTVVKRLIRE